MQKILAYLSPIFRKKTTIFTFILIGVSMSLTVVLKTYYETSYNAYYGEIREDIYHNTYQVSKINESKLPRNKFNSQTRKELEETEHIVGIFHNSTWINGGLIEKFKKNDKIDGRINLQASTNNSIPDIVYGSNFPDDNNENYMICPKNFLPIGGYLEKYSRFDMIDLKDYLNQSINIKYLNHTTGSEDLEISLKLVGIYKNSVSLTDENTCFVKEATLNYMYLTQRGLTETDYPNDESTSYYVQVDKYANKQDVKENLENIGYNVEEITETAYDVFEEIASNISLINTILYGAILILILLIFTKHFFDNLKYYRLLNILGYTKTKVCIINIISNLILILFSSIITLILSIFMKNILELVIYFKPLVFSKFEIIMDYSSLWYIIPISFITSLFISILGCLKLSTDEVSFK